MIDISFSSAVVILLLVMDPVGNVPLFVSVLRDIEPARRNHRVDHVVLDVWAFRLVALPPRCPR